MADETKFTEDEMKQVKSFQEKYFEIQTNFGDLEISRLRLNKRFNELEETSEKLTEDFNKIQEDERNFLDEITKKYGRGSLDPTTGIFKPNKS